MFEFPDTPFYISNNVKLYHVEQGNIIYAERHRYTSMAELLRTEKAALAELTRCGCSGYIVNFKFLESMGAEVADYVVSEQVYKFPVVGLRRMAVLLPDQKQMRSLVYKLVEKIDFQGVDFELQLFDDIEPAYTWAADSSL